MRFIRILPSGPPAGRGPNRNRLQNVYNRFDFGLFAIYFFLVLYGSVQLPLRYHEGLVMSQLTMAPAESFADRRGSRESSEYKGVERRQFGNSYSSLSPEARELAQAIDGYKLRHRRRYVTYEEMLEVIRSLGYTKS